MATYIQGLIGSLDTVVTNIMQDPMGAFLAALDPDLWPMRDQALANGLFAPSYETGQKKVEWTNGALELTEVSLNTQISSNATTEFDFGTTIIQAIRPNMVLKFKAELVRVISVDTTAGTCQVTRGYQSTTPESEILTTQVGHVLSVTPTEKEDAGSGTAAFGSKVTNYAHLFEEVVEVTDVDTILATKTPEKSIAYLVNQKFQTIANRLGKALWLSITGGASQTNPMMNGLRAQVDSTVTVGSVTALKFTHLDARVAACIANGRVPNRLAVGPNVKTQLAQWSQARLKTVSGVDPSQAGGSTEVYISASGYPLTVVVDKSLEDNLTSGAEAFIYRADDIRCGPVPLLPNTAPVHPSAPTQVGIRVERMSRTGPYEKLQCLAYFVGQLLYPTGCGLLTGITSVDSDGV